MEVIRIGVDPTFFFFEYSTPTGDIVNATLSISRTGSGAEDISNYISPDGKTLSVFVQTGLGSAGFDNFVSIDSRKVRATLSFAPKPAVAIDIKPNNKRNVVNPRSRRDIWVAILSNTDPDFLFDPPSQVVIPTVEFGPHGAQARRFKVKDINKDGIGDLLLRFKVRKTGIACGDTEATLSGDIFDGQRFAATDSIKTVGCRRSYAGRNAG